MTWVETIRIVGTTFNLDTQKQVQAQLQQQTLDLTEAIIELQRAPSACLSKARKCQAWDNW